MQAPGVRTSSISFEGHNSTHSRKQDTQLGMRMEKRRG